MRASKLGRIARRVGGSLLPNEQRAFVWLEPRSRSAVFLAESTQLQCAYISTASDSRRVAADRAKELADMIPQLAGQSVFLGEVARLSREQYETARDFLVNWSAVNVKLEQRLVTESELSAIQRDTLIIAQYLPGSPIEELLDELTLAHARTPARSALGQATARAEEAGREAQRAREEAEREAQRAREEAEREAQRAREEAELEALRAREEAKLAAQKASEQAELEALRAREEAKLAAQKASEQAELEAMAGDPSNFVWPLHRILAGMDSMGLDAATVQRLQSKYGWTLSFSRAMHSGPRALRQWFLRAGIDPWELEGVYQCFSQETAAGGMTDARIEKTRFPGVQRVVCSYIVDGKPVELATSLLMYAPVSQPSGGKATSGVAEEEVSHLEASIPGVLPQLHGGEPKPTGNDVDHVPVRCVPLVLTPPRIVLLMRMARCFTIGSSGMQLTGVHGAGKSVLLQALSTVLPLGHPCDMLFVSDASDLLKSAKSCGRQLAQSSGPLVDKRAMGIAIEEALRESKQKIPYNPATTLRKNQRRAKAAWDLSGDRGSAFLSSQLADLHKESGAAMENILSATLERIKHDAVNVRCGRVYILDEVNRLMKRLRQQVKMTRENGADIVVTETHTPQSSAVVDFLPWQTLYPAFCLRILASSPDGVREAATDAESVFYELRPPRFDHLAAILHTAPHFIFPDVQKLPPKKREHFMPLQHAMRACKVLCGNMRRVTSYVAGEYDLRTKTSATVTVDGGTTTVYDSEQLLEASARDYINILVNRMVKTCQNPGALKAQRPWEDDDNLPRGNVGMLPATFYDLAAMNASMGVRLHPQDKWGIYDLLGATMLDALKTAVRNKAIMMNDSRQLRLFARLVMTKSQHFTASGEAMELEVHKRLSMQSLASRKWKLSALAGFDGMPALPPPAEDESRAAPALEWPMHQVMRAMADSASADIVPKDAQLALGNAKCDAGGMWLPARDFPWGSSDPPMVVDLLQASGNERTLIDAGTVRRGRSCLKDGGTVLISTAGNFPRADFVLLQSSGKRRSVTFVEVTKSTLYAHAAGEWYGTLPISLKDMARLTEAEYLTAEHEGGAWRVASDPSFVQGVRYERKKTVKDKSTPTDASPAATAPAGAAQSDAQGLDLAGDDAVSIPVADPPAAASAEQDALPAAPKSMRGVGWTLRGRESLANFWLRALGCPKRLVAHIEGGSTGSKADSTLRITVDDAADATPSAGVEWDISIVYVSGSGEQPAYKEYAKLDCDFAYGVFQADLDDALEEWLYMPQVTA